jgi:hypothetical protein
MKFKDIFDRNKVDVLDLVFGNYIRLFDKEKKKK